MKKYLWLCCFFLNFPDSYTKPCKKINAQYYNLSCIELDINRENIHVHAHMQKF